MPDWPVEAAQPLPVFLSTIEDWVRKTGRLADYTSAAFIDGAVSVPLIVRSTFTAKKLFCLNGAILVGNCQMAIARSGVSPSFGPAPTSSITLASIVAQAGISVWQAFDIPDVILTPGLYYLRYGSDAITGQVQRLYAPTANLGETCYLAGCWLGTYPLYGGSFFQGMFDGTVPILAVGGVA